MAAGMESEDILEKKKLQKSYFDVLGVCCSSEVSLIENILKPLDGVEKISVIVPTRTVIVVHDDSIISQQQIVKALNKARLEAYVRPQGGANYQQKWPSPYAIACGILLAISFLKYVYHPMRWVAIGAVAVGIFPIILKAFASLRNWRLDINTLMLVALIGTIAMHDYIEAGTIVFLFTIAEWLETRASHKATAVMSSLMNIAPQKAVIAETGEEVDASKVKLNTVLAVKAGEVIPLDGIVVDGKCEVDEKTLTGESYPVSKQKDSTVWAGTMNLNGYIGVKTTALAEDCVVAKIGKLVEEAQNRKSKTQRLIDECAQFYTPAVIVISACVAIIPAAIGVHNRNHWFYLALVVLVGACPCALILSTPVVTFCALTKAATSGLLVKGGDYLEVLAKVKVMAFDKTGTITRGEFVVSDFQSLSEDTNLNTLLSWVSSIESKSSHPMATALVEYGKSHSVELKPEDVEDYQNFPGEGIYGKIGKEGIYIGNRKIAQRAAGSETVPSINGYESTGKTIGYVYCGVSPVGIFTLTDACRTGAAQAIVELKSLGIRTAMLTGDNQAAAMHAQEQLGHALDAVHSELLPEDKANILRQFKSEGKTAMIGDGINDAPALATADIGFSMGIAGSALATETGQVILMSNDIRKIPEAIKLARKAHWKVIENIILSFLTKAAILALAFAGHPLVWAAVLADVGTCLLVILNSMLLLKKANNHGGKCSKSQSSSHDDKLGKKCCKPSGSNSQSSAAMKTKNRRGICCQSSAESDAHKRGCESNHFHSSHSQQQQHCCPDVNIAQKPCEPKKCSSHGCAPKSSTGSSNSNSCGNDQCCSDSNGNEDDGHCDPGSCSKEPRDIEAQSCHNSSLCSKHTCSKSAEQHKNTCSKSAEQQGCCSDDHLNSSNCLEKCHGVSNSVHCQEIHDTGKHVMNHITDYESGIINHGCEHHHLEPHQTTMATRREFGGCCQGYYVKECCGKRGHFGAGLGAGSVTEIVSE